jgi:hypothetical protein
MKVERRDLLVVLVLILLWGLFCWRFFTPEEADRVSLPDGDFTQQFYVFRAFAYDEFRHGRFPLWMPCIYAGYPYQADPQSATLYPPLWVTMLALRVMRYGHYPISALVTEVLAHLLATSLFTYAFLRGATARRRTALFGAMTFTYGGFLTGYPLLQISIVETATWLPLALLGAQWFVNGRRINGVMLSSVALGLSVLAGHPQTTLLIFYPALAYWVYLNWQEGRWRALLIPALIVALAAGLSAGQILPTLAYARLSTRSGLSFVQAGTGFPLRDVLQFFLTGLVSYWQPFYVGVLSLALIAVALLTKRRASRGFWMGAALLGLLLSFGQRTPLFDLAYLTWPGYRLFRGQERHALVVSFALAVLAAQGLDVLLSPIRRRERRWLVAIFRYLGLTLPVLLIALGAVVISLQQPDVPTERVILSERLAFFLLMAFLSWLLLGGRLHLGRTRWRIGWLAVAVLVIDLFTFNRPINYAPAVPPFPVTPPVALMLADATPVFRFQDDYRLPGHTGCAHGLEETFGITPIKLARYQEFIERVPEQVRWSLLGVRYVVTWRGGLEPPDGTPILAEQLYAQGEPPDVIYVYRLANEPRFAWVVHEIWSAQDDDHVLTMLADPGFDAHRIAVVKGRAPSVSPQRGDAETVAVVERTPTRIRLQANLSSPGLLVLSQANYPGWEAVVNGESAPLLEANSLFPSVALPSGSSEVMLRYRPVVFYIGLAISGSTLVAVCALLIVKIEKRRRNSSCHFEAD